MNIIIERKASKNKTTLGSLYIDGVFECWTLEDELREIKGVPVEQWKIKGETAIPEGAYSIVIDYSNRFKCMMPHILNVNGFEGIRIHSGNTNADTAGCVLVGRRIEPGTDLKSVPIISESRLAFEGLFEKMQAAIGRGEDVLLRIENPTLDRDSAYQGQTAG